MKTCYLIQARLGSSRYPAKVMSIVAKDKTLIDLVYTRVLGAKEAKPGNVIVLTTDSKMDDPLVRHLQSKNILYFRGDEHNVFKRFYDYLTQSKEKYEYFFRICSDNPFIEPIFIDEMTNEASNKANKNYDYISYQDHQGKPAILTHYGLFCEMISTKAMCNAAKNIKTQHQKEHVTPIFYETGEFKTHFMLMPDSLKDKPYRFTIDTLADAEIVKSIVNKVGKADYTYLDILNIVANDPKLSDMMREKIMQNPKEANK